MPCYADTIVRIKYVYHEQNEIELVLFVPVNFDERDSKTQVVFEKDSFYSVSRKIVPSYFKSNKRPKQKMFDNNNSFEAINTIQSKLLSSHQNIIEDLKRSSKAKATSFTLTNKSYNEAEFNLYSSRSTFSSNRKKSKYLAKSADVLNSIIVNNFDQDETVDTNILDQDDESEGIQKKKRCQKSTVNNYKKGDESADQSLNNINDYNLYQDEVINMNEINQNNESEEIQKNKRG
ncbi:9056_t:CDS:2 [Cetraspora pellucida]|uniref:9056_t:CDS:1 n=1 Tax=Cetraspora pellucida TaxID=1433469 RepID=A0ACA9L448_9GLOM|nr:9056_t:CDS:2 [Cetraspora pellucida]